LSPDIIVHRLSGETYRAITVAPQWSIDKIGVHNAIFKSLEGRDTWQGRVFSIDQMNAPVQTVSGGAEGVAL
jgi:radical SAM superfamily enzyme